MAWLKWRSALVYTHRWLGIAGCVLFIAWFLSGIVMMYVRMPALSEGEKLARSAPLDLTTMRVAADAAAAAAATDPDGIRIGMLDGRPVYRFAEGRRLTAVFADTGVPLAGLSQRAALRLARGFVPEHAASVTYDAYLEEPDQWTLYARQFLPIHRVSVGDRDGSVLYISNRTGEPILKTTRAQRVWGYLGPVIHWVYFTPLRQNTPLWRQLIIGASLFGTLMCLTGLIWGLWRFSPGARYRLKGARSHTPYAGWLRWHHYAGLAFGLVTFTWILSGFFSMSPWEWSPGSSPTPQQRRGLAGGALRLADITPARVQRAATLMGAALPAKELEVVQLAGEPTVVASRPPAPDVARWNSAYWAVGELPDTRIVSLLKPERGAFTRFPSTAVERAARAAMPGVAVREATWLTDYDAYYYDKHYARTLPALRVRFADAGETWLYVDPARGAIALNHGTASRAERWLYHGLHSLDFPDFYAARPLWDIVLIVLSLGGLGLSALTLVPAYRRLRRHAVRTVRGAGDAATAWTATLSAACRTGAGSWRGRPTSVPSRAPEWSAAARALPGETRSPRQPVGRSSS